MKKLTVRWLMSHMACSEAVERFSSQAESDPVRVISLLMDEGNFEWANWLIVRIMTRKQYLMYAIFSAESVLDIYERGYPQDNRVRLAIEAARVVCQNDCKKNRTAAEAAMAVAWAAARAAGDVRGAVEAAMAVAWAAAETERSSIIEKRIINYGIKLLTGEEK